jgi:hypothetical protein
VNYDRLSDEFLIKQPVEERRVMMLRKLMSEIGGRTWIFVCLFNILAMVTASLLMLREEFTAEHWLQALSICSYLAMAWLGKRGLEEIGEGLAKRKEPSPPGGD